jgi:hypothetical protein
MAKGDRVSPWNPITNPTDLKHLGKLSEELGECISELALLNQVIARCIIQGVHETNPYTGVENLIWMEAEIADVQANLELVIERFKLNKLKLGQRRARKMKLLRIWHNIPENNNG